jgi:hypothetical protein
VLGVEIDKDQPTERSEGFSLVVRMSAINHCVVVENERQAELWNSYTVIKKRLQDL